MVNNVMEPLKMALIDFDIVDEVIFNPLDPEA